MRYLVAICMCTLAITATAQDITGTWEEYSDTRFTSYTKICIVKICDKYIGYSYDKDDDGGYCKTDLLAVFDKKRKHFIGECMGFLMQTPGHVLGLYNLYYKAKRGDEYLEGLVYEKLPQDSILHYSFRDSIDRDLGRPEFIKLIKTSDHIDSSDYMRLMASHPCKTEPPVIIDAVHAISTSENEKISEMSSPNIPITDIPLSPILQMQASRTNDTLSTISTTEKELFIQVMDNAIVDGDTISIIHNGKLIAERILVSAKPYPIKIELSRDNPYHELILVAHNLGSIPPNTALLLIQYGHKEYRLHAIADLSKNALIVFKYRGD